MATLVLIDAGPLIAWLVRADQHHDWAVEQFAALPIGLSTCEAVVTEASLIVGYHGGDAATVVELVNRGVLKLDFDLQEETDAIARLMRRYRNVPMSLADACLVRMSERHEDSQILTTDSDFQIYRRLGRKAISTIMPL